MGMLLTSFFIHNFILTLLKNQKNPENNKRDLSIGYLLVGLSLALTGGTAYFFYGNSLTKFQNFLEMFNTKKAYPLTARAALILQLVSVMPLVMFIIRIQVWGFLMNTNYPSFWHVFFLNLFMMIICTLIAVFYPHVGDVLRYSHLFYLIC
jgi:sodium-coupled neutral amino acid transporter 9